MTSNQINARRQKAEEQAAKEQQETNRRNARTKEREQKTKEQSLEETKRSNKQKEIKGFLDTAVSGLKLIPGANDPSWYNTFPELVRDAANLSFNSAIGIPSLQGQYAQSSVAYPDVPGIMSIGFVPSLPQAGTGVAGTNAITVAARSNYAAVRRVNSGAANYDPSDLMEYYYLVGSAYTLVSHIAKCYSVANTAKIRNRYYPYTMAQACKFDLDDALLNLATYRSRLNALIIQLNTFAIPKGLKYIERYVWLSGNIFKDSEIHKSQEYVFVPEVYYTWGEEKAILQANLSPTGILSNVLDGSNYYYAGAQTISSLPTIGAWLDALQTIVTSLLSDTDLGNMSGDVLKAYGDNGIMTFPMIGEQFHVESVFSMEVLSQITNITLVGDISEYQKTIFKDDYATIQQVNQFNIGETNNGVLVQGGITQSPVSVASSPIIYKVVSTSTSQTLTNITAPATDQHAVINFYKDSPTPDEIMVASRGVTLYHVSDEPTRGSSVYYYEASITSCGTEIFTAARIFSVYAQGDDTNVYIEEYFDLYNQADYARYMLKDAFNWGPCPRDCYADYDAESANYYTVHTGRDFCNYSVVPNTTINNMHQAAAMSLFLYNGSTIK